MHTSDRQVARGWGAACKGRGGVGRWSAPGMVQCRGTRRRGTVVGVCLVPSVPSMLRYIYLRLIRIACCCLLLQDLYESCARGGSEKRGRVLWDATSRGLCGRVGPPRTNVLGNEPLRFRNVSEGVLASEKLPGGPEDECFEDYLKLV